MTPTSLRDDHFARLNDYRQTREYADWCESIGWARPAGDLPSILGQRWEIDEAIYHEFLEIMPPLHWRGGSFFMCEESFGGLHSKFTEQGGRYWCEFALLPRRANAPALGMEP